MAQAASKLYFLTAPEKSVKLIHFQISNLKFCNFLWLHWPYWYVFLQYISQIWLRSLFKFSQLLLTWALYIRLVMCDILRNSGCLKLVKSIKVNLSQLLEIIMWYVYMYIWGQNLWKSCKSKYMHVSSSNLVNFQRIFKILFSFESLWKSC